MLAHTMQLVRIASVLSVLATSAVGQTTHLVGPGGFAQISGAIAAAAPGDVILVQPGNYDGFAVGIGVTIRGLAAGVNVFVLGASIPAGQTLHLANLEVLWMFQFTGGSVTLDGCKAPACTAASTRLTLQSCTIGSPAGGDGLIANGSYVAAVDSVFYGKPYIANVTPTPAVQLTNSTFHGSHLVCNASNGWQPAVKGVNSTVWISDSSLSSGTLVNPPPCAVDVPQGRLARCTLNPPCAPSIPTTGPLLGLHRPSPLQSPGPFTIRFDTDPNGLVAVYVSGGVGQLTVPFLEQAILLDASTIFHRELLTADGLGVATGTWNVPAGLTNHTLWFQAVGTASPLQLSPIAGGVVR